ncbi:hypothetical protein G7Y89_g1007 [Cudoniella acicularis]|uniref:Aminoglycoside phosphotransferase domain-containing protein n=1 Tax=Cudoniella acicularis TaxID=354080 RepID=A0A8H4RX45_9HELO|nr:hypothetical protein G7Y89_g1007 [Cudoniella acicularis]
MLVRLGFIPEFTKVLFRKVETPTISRDPSPQAPNSHSPDIQSSSFTTMRNEIVDRRVQQERERFIEAIDLEAICQLASSYHNGEACSIFKEPSHGSYNLCIYVAFPLSGDRWVVRIPIVPCLASAEGKLEQEVGAMRCVVDRTKIPIPQIYGYSFKSDNPIGLAFLIIDFVEGITLQDVNIRSLAEEQRNHLYLQLADILIQLRRLEFPHIGALLPDPRVESGWTSKVPRRPLSIESNGQEVEGIRAFEICDNEKVYTSAKDYIRSLIRLAFHQFEEGQNSVENEYDACVVLYNLYQFQDLVEKWVDQDLDSGPFVLIHGDLRPPNIMLNEKLDIVAVIDWEWSRIVPLQLFIPPTWFTWQEVGGVCSPLGYLDYVQELDAVRAMLAARERQYDGRLLLSKEWSKIHRKGGVLIAAALNNPALIDTVYSGYLDLLYHHSSHIGVRAKEFINSSEEYKTLIRRKVRDRISYLEEMRLVNQGSDELHLRRIFTISRCFGRLTRFWTPTLSQLRYVESNVRIVNI